jgi:6-phosphogluconolactonase
MSTPDRGTLYLCDDAEALARTAAEWLCAEANARPGVLRICLSGGSTPRRLYQRLSDPGRITDFPWARVQWFWGDERFVPHDHPDSNYRMAREALFDRAAVPADRIHPIPTEGLSPDAAATDYEHTLRRIYGAERLHPERPLFDVTLLGLGEDGHTASLLPGSPVLDEAGRWVAAVAHGRPEARITLTYPALNASHAVAFVVSGEDKRDALAAVWRGDRASPAAGIRPLGTLHWFIDRAAAPTG